MSKFDNILTCSRYLITVSSDQTTRVHAPWKQSKQDGLKWHEVARPQVHGHDLTCVTALPGHRFASGADEKIVRVFESTKMFLRNLASITGRASISSVTLRCTYACPLLYADMLVK